MLVGLGSAGCVEVSRSTLVEVARRRSLRRSVDVPLRWLLDVR